MKKLPLSFIGLMVFLSVSTQLWAQNSKDSLALQMDAIFKKYDLPNRPGCAVAVIRNDSVVFKKGYGMANLEYDIPIKPSSVFDIASVSKQFAGFAIATLVEQKKVGLDDDIHKYLPEVPDFGKTITVRHLVHHTSGLRDWPEALHVAGWRWEEAFSFSDIMRMVKNQKDLDFEPGLKYSYSNTGYNLLAAIVEKVSGQSFRTWTDSTIFTPLGMTSSHFMEDYTEVVKNLAYSYSPTDKGFKKSLSTLTAYGSSSLFTSAEDLCKWVINFDKNIAAKNPVYLRMLEKGILNNGEKVDYGYGLATEIEEGFNTVSHTGGWASYRTVIMNYPEQHLSFIILSNAGDFNLGGSIDEVAHVWLKFPTNTTTDTKPVSIKDLPTIKGKLSLLQKYTGTYQLGPNWAVTITLENGQLMTQANKEDKFPMETKSDSTFWVNAYGAYMTFVKDSTGGFNKLQYKAIQAKRITPWKPAPSQLNRYLGTYYSKELGTEYMVKKRGDQLYLQHFRLGESKLGIDPTSEDQFGANIGSIHFFRHPEVPAKVSGFYLSGGRIQHIRFDRRK